jgi:hypothetical protein
MRTYPVNILQKTSFKIALKKKKKAVMATLNYSICYLNIH